MGKINGQGQAIVDQAEVEILKDNQVMREDLAAIEQSEEDRLDREMNIRIAERLLDGHEYNLERITAEVGVYIERMSQDYVAVGRRLLAVKQVEGFGNYMKWLEGNFQLSTRTAQKYAQVALALEQRPDLAPIAKSGVSKALALLELPEEYLDEAQQEGTLAGKPLDEFQAMSHREIVAEVKRLKRNQEKIIAEGNKALEAERDALIEENLRLKKFAPAEAPTPEWCLEQSENIKTAALQVITLCRSLLLDERMKDDIQTQAKIEGNINLAIKGLQDFNREWDDTFNQVEG
jgi:hypothetical protein